MSGAHNLKKTIILFTIGVTVMLLFFGCGAKKYKVDYCGGKDWFKGAKDEYRKGEKVELYYDLIATDTDYSFLLDNEKLNVGYSEDKGFIITFTMPEHDVKLEVTHRNTMIADDDDGKRYSDTATLKFDSFDGGGPDYTAVIDDPSVASCLKEIEYARKDHDEIDGAAFDAIFTFTGLKAGETFVTITGYSPIMGVSVEIYDVTVRDDLKICVEPRE